MDKSLDSMMNFMKGNQLKIGLALGSSLLLWLGKRYYSGPNSPITKSMENKTIIITGSNSGIGRETAAELLAQGANVIFACRSKERALAAIESLPEESRKRATFIQVDLCDFNSIYNFTQEFRKLNKPIDILINNAGLVQPEFRTSKDGIEVTFQANHFGHKVLTFLLFDLMNKKEARILNVSSAGNAFASYRAKDFKRIQSDLFLKDESKNFSMMDYYQNSKLMNVYFTQHLAEICENKYPHIKSACIHPGLILSEISNNATLGVKILFYILYPLMWFAAKTAKSGAQTTLYLCYEDFEKIQNGEYYADCKRKELKEHSKNLEIRAEAIKWSYMVLEKSLEGKFELPKL